MYEMNLIDHQIKKLGVEYFYMNEYFKNEYGVIDPTSLESSAGQRMKTKIINKSYQYAKRQMTWNKKYLKNVELVKVN